MQAAAPHILILDAPPVASDFPGQPPEQAALTRKNYHATIQFTADLSPSELDQTITRCDALLTWTQPISAEMLERAERCLLVQIYGPGNAAAHVELETARRLGVYVASHPAYASDLWAEHTLAALVETTQQNGWGPRDLKSKRLGLSGLGQVGLRVARGAQKLGLRVFAYDPFCPREHFDFNEVIQVYELDELVGSAHILSLHLPLMGPTRNIIAARQLRLLPREAILLNFSQPELVDLTALATILDDSRRKLIAAFAAPLPALAAHPRLVDGIMADPWPAAACLYCRTEVGQLLAGFFSGNRPPHLLIDPPCPRQALAQAASA